MIGGEKEVVDHLDPLFSALAPGRGDLPRTPGREAAGGTAESGYLHCGPTTNRAKPMYLPTARQTLISAGRNAAQKELI